MARRLLVGSVLVLSLLMNVERAWSGERTEREAEARQLVAEALHREIYGDSAARDLLLERAARLAPELDQVRWHRGEVRFQDRWQSPGEVAESLAEQPRWKRYDNQRAEQPETFDGQLTLANWCRNQNMPEQERAHLFAALQFAPDHPEVRARLGFRRLNGSWVSDEQLAAVRRRSAAARRALAAWQPRCEELRRDLSHRSLARREAAAERIAAIDDPEAIPAMEAVLSPWSESAAGLVVATVAAMPSSEATGSLVRHGVLSPWESVRTAAAKALRKRDREYYVPALLTSMYSPVVSSTRIARGEDGELLYRHAFYREGQDARQLLVLDTAFHRIQQPGGDRQESLGRAVGQLAASVREREMQVGFQNLRTQQLNSRITYVLGTATGEHRPAMPNDWWQWWNEENEVFVVGEKTLQTAYRAEQVAVSDRPVSSSGPAASGSSGGVQRSDCLAAGTPVWTGTGPQPIEQIRVGDLVLSQDPTSGELAYKPVLQTTVRPRGPLVRVRIGNRWFETSGGHLFWVSGEGWVKSRELESGMEVHTPHGTRLVRERELGSEQETYNLVVADFATYFVGPDKLLSHDNTIRRPTEADVPGLCAR